MAGRHRHGGDEPSRVSHRRTISATPPGSFALRQLAPVKENVGEQIYFICTGNIVRSAFAQYHAGNLTGKHHAFTSRGIAALVGQDMHPDMKKFFHVKPRHEAVQAFALDLRRASLIIAMSQRHVDWIGEEAPEVLGRTLLLTRLESALAHNPPPRPLNPIDISTYVAALPTHRTQGGNIADPLGGASEDFQRCALEIDRKLRIILPWVAIG